MSASNTAHVPMDEPHLSRYGANAARALELEGAVRPGTVAREMRRALAEVERARQELARWAEESGRTPGAVEWLLDNAYLAQRARWSPSDWSARARKWAEASGIVAGDGEGNQRYQSFTTREETVQMLYRLDQILSGADGQSETE